MEANVSTTPESRIRKEVTVAPIMVARVYKASYQKDNTMTAELKQTIETLSFYPTKSVSNELKDNPFSNAQLGISEGEPYKAKETRVTWIEVPVDSTVESVQEKLASLPEANIYKILANHPVISSSQDAGIKAGLTTLDIIADGQAVRYGKDHPQAGQLVLQNGKPQFRVTYFKVAGSPDVDMRTEDPADFYATEKMKGELTAVTTSIRIEQEVM
jgi:hypothetical protein